MRKHKLTYSRLLALFGRYNRLFTMSETKVLIVMFSRLPFNLSYTYVSISYRKLQQLTGISNKRVAVALEELQKIGAVRKVSGLTEKEEVRKMKLKIFKRPMEWGAETNVYDLTPLIAFLDKLDEIEETFRRKYVNAFYRRPKLKEHPFFKLSLLRKETPEQFTLTSAVDFAKNYLMELFN